MLRCISLTSIAPATESKTEISYRDTNSWECRRASLAADAVPVAVTTRWLADDWVTDGQLRVVATHHYAANANAVL